jgi:hypothetical protein
MACVDLPGGVLSGGDLVFGVSLLLLAGLSSGGVIGVLFGLAGLIDRMSSASFTGCSCALSGDLSGDFSLRLESSFFFFFFSRVTGC